MAERREDDTIYWIDPEARGILPLDQFHVSHSLRHTLRHRPFEITVNQSFAEIISLCAASRPGRYETWINRPIEELCLQLHRMGFAHSIEIWEEKALAGGLYGISLGGVFFGESMVSLKPDASKIALVELVARLQVGNFRLLDTQFVTTHLTHFGAVEIPREEYRSLLKEALPVAAQFPLGSRSFWKDLIGAPSQSSTTKS